MFDNVSDDRIVELFLHTGQEDLRLQAALKGYFILKGDLEGDRSALSATVSGQTDRLLQDLSAYIRRRIRPAAEKLADAGGAELLRTLDRDGFFTSGLKKELALRFSDGRHPAAWLAMLCPDMEEKSRKGLEIINKKAETRCCDSEGNVKDANVDGIPAEEALRKVRKQLYAVFPVFGAALSGLVPAAHANTRSLGTDGTHLFFDPEYVEGLQKNEPARLRRLYLHTLLHCLFHLWRLPENARNRADDMIEDLIEKECSRNSLYREVLGERLKAGEDDHSFWPGDAIEQDAELDRRWELLQMMTGSRGDSQGRTGGPFGIGSEAGDKEILLAAAPDDGHDYRTFLSQFAVLREEVHLNPEEFDYIYYTLGMQHGGTFSSGGTAGGHMPSAGSSGLPLLEPLECTEGHRLSEIVIAIDTSGSCTDEMVQRFLTETWSIVSRKENFFHDMSVYILQCDCVIQDATHITSAEEWQQYGEEIRIIGRGGTDFRPVFRYVEDLQRDGSLADLRCLIYFTDGDGIFPEQAPPYETVFVFTQRSENKPWLPDWVRELYVDELN